jgi:hypothetical protein
VPRPERRALLGAGAFAVVALLVKAWWAASDRQVSDVSLYLAYGDRIARGEVPYADFDFEYPPGALPVLALPALVSDGRTGYDAWFGVLLAVTGAVGVLLVDRCLARLGRTDRERGWTLVALAASPLVLGALLLDRFDLLPATLTVAAVAALLGGRPRAAGAALGAAIAVKLYPVALVPLALAWVWRRDGRRAAVMTGALALAVPVAAYLPFLVAAPDGVAHSLAHQASRPLQIESVGAGLLLAAHQLAGLDLEWRSGHGSQNLVGGLPDALAVGSSTLQVAVLVALWLAFARDSGDGERLTRFAAAAVCAFLALGKVLSPQFLVWLLFLVPLVGGVRGRLAAGLYGTAALLTAAWFPARYWSLVRELEPLASWLVTVRGLVLVALLAVLALPVASLSAARRRAPARSPTPVPSPGRR